MIENHWVNSIESHPILDWKNETKETIKDSNHSCKSLLSYQNGDVYITNNHKIRTCNLRDFKRSLEDKTQPTYKNLVTSDTKFDQTLINQSGSILALYNENEISVAVLKSDMNSNSSITCNTVYVGEKYYSKDSYVKIVKVLWHPLSAKSSHLMVLTSNGMLRMFNVLVDLEEPEQCFSLCQKDTPGKIGGKAFGLNVEKYHARTFTLGTFNSVKDGWSIVTVYGLLESGDLVSICPVLPNDSRISLDWVKETIATTTSEWNLSNKEDSVIASNFYWALKWLTDIQENYHPERSVIRPLQDREPLRSAPWNIEPESVYGLEKFGIPVQLSVTHTAISPIITLAFDSGNLVLGLVMQTVLPVWVTDKSQFEIIYSLTVHEVITVSSGFSSNIDLYCDRHLVDTIFYRSANGIYQIQLDIGRYLDESQLIDVEKPLASVRQLIDTGNDVITGFQIISDLTLGPSYICLVSTGQLIADLIFKVHNQQKAVQTVDPKNVKTLSDFDYSALDCVAKMSTLSTKSKPYPEFIDKESFKKVGENIVETRKKIQIIVSGFAKLKQRVEELENAQTSQAETTVKVEEQILRLKTKSTEVTKRFKELKSRNEIQYQRITTILEILYDLTQPKLSSQEIKWFKEMTMMNNEFENHHKPTVEHLKKRIASIDTTEEKDNQFEIVLGTQQVRDVQRNLKEESEELKSLTKRIATMNLMVDNLLAQNENK
ncbi:hypothetical protein BC833DRAFT_594517 [Globomyces pollinis-pini]|nr:hypothetical protein BC833DRAFT_594517 [Globomyces pollinis-pini]